jgi:adenylylsulfate reductase subunit B
MPPIIDPNKCTGCGICVDVCAEDVFFGSKKGKVPVVTYPEFCVHFNCCVYECPEPGAITVRIPLPQMLLYSEGGS